MIPGTAPRRAGLHRPVPPTRAGAARIPLIPASSRPRRWLARFAAALLAAHLVAALPAVTVRSWRRLLAAGQSLDEPPQAVRRELLGADYVAAIEQIRARVPRRASYLLVDGGAEELGATYWVRFDLAPRHPLLVGRWEGLVGEPELRRPLPRGPKVVVIALPEGPPLLLDRAAFQQRIRERRW